MSVPTPPVIPRPFAEAGLRDTIPDTTAASGRASYTEGFPPETMQPIVAGGKPPNGLDMNGILYALSAHAAYVQAGQPYMYDSAVVTAIGGYAVGTLLGSVDGSTVWMSTVSNNTTDPDASGAGWVPVSAYGFSSITGLIGGVRTLTRVEAKYGTIVLSGVLVANLTVVLPTDLRSWRIVNSTTGSFTTTVKTAAGSGVTVPQGGYSASVGVFGDGTNIYLQVPPVALPIDANPTPSTIVERTNTGDVFARYFNSNAIVESGLTLSAFLIQNNADTYLRKVSVTDAAKALGVLGVGQTWQYMNASRSPSFDYVNTTGRPIFVSIWFNVGSSNPGGTGALLVDGVTVSVGSTSNTQAQFSISAIVPAGSTYRMDIANIFNSYYWAELR